MDADLLAALFQPTEQEMQKSQPAPEPAPRPLTKEQADAFVFDGNTTGGLRSMRCGKCREVKAIDARPPDGFPPSCATWRRGSCRSCRAAAAKAKPLISKKLESARQRYGSVKTVKLHDVERLIRDAGLDASDDLKRYYLTKRDAALPFTVDNAMWVTSRNRPHV
jgi:hypothetical protein